MKLALIVGLAFLMAASPALARNRIVTIVNKTSYNITDFYAANRDDGKWGGTFLPGRQVLPPNYELDVNIDDGSGYCIFDFLAVYEDGVTSRKDGINACALDVFYFTQE